MKTEDPLEPDVRLTAALTALREDPAAAVPRAIESELLVAFRARQVVAPARHDQDLEVPPALEGRLVAAFRAHHASSAATPGPGRSIVRVLALAAAILVMIGGVAWFALSRSTPPTSVTASAGAPAAQQVPSPALAAPRRETRGRLPAASQTRPPLPSAGLAITQPSAVPTVAENGAAEAADDDQGFIPLAYGAPLPGVEAHVVSVDLPRTALLDFGLPADAASDDSPSIRAEVLMREDGMPSGIRFMDRAPVPGRAVSGAARPAPSVQRRQQP
jgi:HAMP domain-containing protein